MYGVIKFSIDGVATIDKYEDEEMAYDLYSYAVATGGYLVVQMYDGKKLVHSYSNCGGK